MTPFLGAHAIRKPSRLRSPASSAAVVREAPDGSKLPVSGDPMTSGPDAGPWARWTWTWTVFAVTGLLAVHLALAERSLVLENPTIDEVVHLPAGVTYWQKGTFRLYHHSPPLCRMVAALPVIWENPVTAPVYEQESWTSPEPSPTTFSQTFAYFNAARYLELFQLARRVMPLFSILGGLVVFDWSRRLYGKLGGLLSLTLWVFCPNILAHCRLITTDVGSTALGAAATFVFWLYLRRPSWPRAVAAGVLLGLAELTKFSMLLLYAVWPFLWLVWLILVTPRPDRLHRALLGVVHGLSIVSLSVLVIDAAYRFEGVGIPLERFEFASGTLTSPVATGVRKAPASKNPLFAIMWPFRENRFRGTVLAKIPALLPEHYLLGFDEQKVEAEGIPNRLRRAYAALRKGDVELARQEAGSADRSVGGYPVYLNGVMQNTGWWHYYIGTLLYKVPEGTWVLVLLSLLLLLIQQRKREAWADEVCLWTVPVVVLFSMSLLTDINLGLRYILSIAPYVFVAAGKVVPWVEDRSGRRLLIGRVITLASLGLTIAAALWIHPHYLAYFNWGSGGPDRVPARLIDSNLDWGQDLLGLRVVPRVCTGATCRSGLFWSGQPLAIRVRPARGSFRLVSSPCNAGFDRVSGRQARSAPSPRGRTSEAPGSRLLRGQRSLVYGLPWRLYDPSPDARAPVWNAGQDAFGYFRKCHFQPIAESGIRSTSTSSVRKTSIGLLHCWNLGAECVFDRP